MLPNYIVSLAMVLLAVCIFGCKEEKVERNLDTSKSASSPSVVVFDFEPEPRGLNPKPCEGKPATGSIYSVFAMPATYTGYVVDIIGFLTIVDEQAYIFPNQDFARARVPQMGIYVGRSDTSNPDCDRGPTGFRRWLVVWGRSWRPQGVSPMMAPFRTVRL